MTVGVRAFAAAIGLALIVYVGGCSKANVEVPTGSAAETENLTAIRKAYMAATTRLGRPPKDLDELKPSLASEANADKLLVSPNDGLPYVIVYGADPRKNVIAFEQKGVDGVRVVVDQTQLPKKVNSEQFNMLTFPSGFKKPDFNK
jgi:hypothetical protein